MSGVTRRVRGGLWSMAVAGGVLAAGLSAAQAQVNPPPPEPQIGSPNTVSADPTVPRPHTKPCTVTLLHNQQFADFNPKSFSYAPPAECPGPWSKVVLTADFTVTAGRQYDRTAEFFIGNANIFYGTTAEPRKTLSPSWHIERDETDLSAIFKSAQSGQAILGNFVGVSGGVTYDGIIYADAQLEFYPASYQDPAPRVADVVVPLPNAPGGAVALNTTASQLAQPVTLPRNTEAVYLDVFAQSQSADEFWYTCVPNDVMGPLQSCGNTAFRETEIAIDGQPAGVAPVYPWVYTGGIDPYLWAPIPGIQTLNFKPYRVNLTPFAGVLADGQAHTVSISVFNANSYFLATANLLAFTDHRTEQVTGGVLNNTLFPAPTPVTFEQLNTDKSGTVRGFVNVVSNRNYSISGYVNTSHGRVETTVDQTTAFSNSQRFVVGATQYVQDISQTTEVGARTTTRSGSGPALVEDQHFSYPFSFNIDEVFNKDGSITEGNVASQKYLSRDTTSIGGRMLYESAVSNVLSAQDTDVISVVNGGYAITSHYGQKSMQHYLSHDTLGHCYNRTLTAANSVLTGVKDSKDCGSF